MLILNSVSIHNILELNILSNNITDGDYLNDYMKIERGKLVTRVFNIRPLFKILKILYFNSNIYILILRNVLLNGIKRIEILISAPLDKKADIFHMYN